MPRGTCGPRAVCVVPRAGENMCMTGCAVADDYVSTGGCPRGHRCFRVRTADDEVLGICYLDCDAEHPCPEGWVCDPDGGCDAPG
ncbi:MAG: hypothetical protein KF729_12800 [Sandaracinaceae bacterium]|nr:hypothetical protein [Sandaracinaceae bacterium]